MGEFQGWLIVTGILAAIAAVSFMAGREGPVDDRDALCSDLYAAQTTRADSLEVYVRHPYCTLEEDDE